MLWHAACWAVLRAHWRIFVSHSSWNHWQHNNTGAQPGSIITCVPTQLAPNTKFFTAQETQIRRCLRFAFRVNYQARTDVSTCCGGRRRPCDRLFRRHTNAEQLRCTLRVHTNPGSHVKMNTWRRTPVSIIEYPTFTLFGRVSKSETREKKCILSARWLEWMTTVQKHFSHLFICVLALFQAHIYFNTEIYRTELILRLKYQILLLLVVHLSLSWFGLLVGKKKHSGDIFHQFLKICWPKKCMFIENCWFYPTLRQK